MNIDLLFTTAALIAHAFGLVLWLRLHKRVECCIWWVVVAGFLLLAAHRICELLQYTGLANFGSFTALLIALVVLGAVLQTTARIKRQERQRIGLQAIESRLEQLQLQQRHDSIAVQIAEILNALRLQIDYYEHQAESHKLPFYKPNDNH